MINPLVSVVSFAYNHEKFIIQALDGFLIQKTNFAFEIVIHDDASTDNTADIIREYEAKYPDIIKPIYQKENQKSKGDGIVTRTAFEAVRGKYIALCEGDDYWIDPYKLQKQVYFLENNSEYSMCFHDALILWDDKSQPPKYFCPKNQKITSSIEDIINDWFIPSASMVFRKDDIMPIPSWFAKVYNGDWTLQMLLANRGKIRYIDEVMSVYRKSQGAFSGGVGKDVEFVNNKKILSLDYINEFTNFKYEYIISRKIKLLNSITRKYKVWKRSKLQYCIKYPEYILKNIWRKIFVNN